MARNSSSLCTSPEANPVSGVLGEKMKTREALLVQLNETISQLCGVYENIENPEIAVNESWTAKDLLGHITFWHESFARNVSDIVNDRKPTPLKGKYSDLNQQCFAEMKPHTVEEIMKRLDAAHNVIQANILNDNIVVIPYKKGARDYTPEEHLDIVNKHIQGHMRDVEKARKGASLIKRKS